MMFNRNKMNQIRKMKLQIIGDLHLEYINFEEMKISELINASDAEILILAGDIGTLYEPQKLRLFLEKICSHYRYVLYVPGNTEFYKRYKQTPLSFDSLLNTLLKIESAIKNLFVLYRKSVQIDNVLFSGAILWSYPDDELPSYFRIHNFDREKYTNMHLQDSKYILDSLCYSMDLNIDNHVVITHYCPLPGERANRSDMYYNKQLFSKLSDLETYHTNFTWIFGHTHEFVNIKKKGINFISNSRGKLKNVNKDYKSDYVINI